MLLVHTYSDKPYTVLCTQLPVEKEVRTPVPSPSSEQSCQSVRFMLLTKSQTKQQMRPKKHCEDVFLHEATTLKLCGVEKQPLKTLALVWFEHLYSSSLVTWCSKRTAALPTYRSLEKSSICRKIYSPSCFRRNGVSLSDCLNLDQSVFQYLTWMVIFWSILSVPEVTLLILMSYLVSVTSCIALRSIWSQTFM